MGAIYIEVTRDYYDYSTFLEYAAYIAAPFAAKDSIKELPKRRWDKARRRWVIPRSDVQLAAQMLRQQGWQVEVINPTGSRTSGSSAPVGKTWADQMYAALPKRLHVPAYKALAKVLHPDVGGDLVAMQALTAAHDKAVAA